MKQTLTKAGLTSNEAEVYLTLLQKGMSTASIVATSAGMHRTSVYSALARLEKKDLVSTLTLDGGKRYQAAHPRKIESLMLEQVGEMRKVLPALEEVHSASQEDEAVRFVSGVAGIQSVHEEILSKAREFCGYGSGLRAAKVLRRYLSRFATQAVAQGIKSRMVFSTRFEGMDKNSLEERRYFDGNPLGPESVRIYGDKVALMYFLIDEPFGIVISSPALVEAYRKRFEWLWDRSSES